MSLRVWLPLNGDLRNNGLSNVDIVDSNLTVDNNGKIGKCYSFNGSNSKITNTFNTPVSSSIGSLACWVKFNAFPASGKWYTLLQLGNLGGYATCRLGLYMEYTDKICVSVDGSSQKNLYTHSLQINQWYHICTTYDGNIIKLYINGIEVMSTVAVKGSYTTGASYLFMGATNNFWLNGYMNDARYYDHALSAKEVKELSKGLVCHYPLNSPYIEGTTNLVTTEDCLSATCYNGATGKYGYGTNTDMYKVVGNFQGKKCTKLYMGTSGLSARPYPYIANLFVSNGTNQPEYKTLSFDYYATIGTYINPYKLGSGSATCNWTNDSSDIKNGTFTNSGNIPIVTNKWQHITMTLHGTTDANAEWGYIIMGDTHVSDVSNYWLFANMQIETKDHETGYAGVGGTRNENIIYDSSGYNNYAQKYVYDTTGTIEISSNTPRNSLSTYVNSENNTTNTASGTVFLYGNCGLVTPNYLTVAFWCKPIAGYGGGTTQGQFCTTSRGLGINSGSDYSTTAMHHRDAIIDMCTSTSIHKTVSIAFTANEWHHYAIVYDGRYGRVYKDGVQTSTLDMGSNLSLASFTAIVIGYSNAGGVYRSNKSYYSDFRLYSTALSEEDIRELYNIPISISNNGSIFTQGEYVEV